MTASSLATLKSVLTAVGQPVLQALCLPQGPDLPAGEPALLDPADGVCAPPGSLLLAVGCRPGAADAAAAIGQAARTGLSAVVVKCYGDDLTPALAAAESAGIALLVVDDSVPWTHLHLLLSAAVSGDRWAGHEPLSAVLSGDLFALANAVAALVGGAIAIEDPHQHVLAYSNVPGQVIDDVRQTGILGRRVPAEFRLADVYEQVRRSETVLRVVLDGIRPRLATAIRAGDEPIGSIWAIEGDGGFAPDAARALADAARLASLHILRLRTTADVERTARAQGLRALLLGRPGPVVDALPTVDRLDVTVVAFQLADGEADPDGTLLTRTADLVTVFCESVHRTAACLTLGQTIYALLPTSPGADRTVLPALVERVISRAVESLRVTMRAGIGGTVADLAAVAQSREEADRVLQVLAERADGPAVATIADVRSRTVLRQLQEVISGDPRLTLEVLDRIAAYDASKGTGYLDTLRAYLDSFGDVPAASLRIFLHQNTFRHRMRRMTEIFGLNLDDPDERLVLWLLLRTSC
ncbi:PucR family transcriptional regulator [Nakamurella lactea]|uniref:PucR family transcriptional regulator n=1 Tax=Nakamurella lactea TaxID=459515 RepID=UPI000404E253|nr:PucR family transcriptional regulator [Nakamurella lactea]